MPLLLAALVGCVNQHAEVQTYRNVVDAGLPRPKSYQPGQPLSLARAMALAEEAAKEAKVTALEYTEEAQEWADENAEELRDHVRAQPIQSGRK